MSVLFDLNIFVTWSVVKDVDKKVTAVMIVLEFNG
jgi:hypothetical protein